MTAAAPTFADIEDAAQRLAGHAVRTPLLACPAADAVAGGRVLIKPEMLQRTGSFKFRGAFNCITRLDDAARSRGLVAFSSGNHAQAVAAVAALFGVKATIVMPADAPAMKIGATRGHGADIVTYDRFAESREEIAADIVSRTGSTLIPPFDHPDIIAGQGTAGLEIVEDLASRDLTPDRVLVPCGGGGLIAGVATAIKARFPNAEITSVEPAGFDDTARSLAAGNRETADPAARSICDALLAPTPGELTFSINRNALAGGVAVTDDQARAAIAFAFRHLKLVAEPGGAVALAAVLNGLVECRNRTTVAVMSGGNVDPALFAGALEIAG